MGSDIAGFGNQNPWAKEDVQKTQPPSSTSQPNVANSPETTKAGAFGPTLLKSIGPLSSGEGADFEATVAHTSTNNPVKDLAVQTLTRDDRAVAQNPMALPSPDKDGFLPGEAEAIKAYLESHKADFAALQAPTVIRREGEGLARSLLVFRQEDGAIKAYALLKQKGGIRILGEGGFKKATWALDMETGQRKVFLTERSEIELLRLPSKLNEMTSVPDSISDDEVKFMKKYFGSVVVVDYTHKDSLILIEDPLKGRPKRGLLVEAMTGGSMHSYVSFELADGTWHAADKTMPDQQTLSILSDVSDVLSNMHANGDMYLDLNLENIMIDKDGKGRLVDFSFSRNKNANPLDKIVGTPFYRAPEQSLTDNIAKTDEKADVWSIGMVIYDMLQHKEGKAAYELGYFADKDMAGAKPDDNPFDFHCWPKRIVRDNQENIIEAKGSTLQDIQGALDDWKAQNLPNRAIEGSPDWIIDKCMQLRPKDRISMDKVRDALNKLKSQGDEPGTIAA